MGLQRRTTLLCVPTALCFTATVILLTITTVLVINTARLPPNRAKHRMVNSTKRKADGSEEVIIGRPLSAVFSHSTDEDRSPSVVPYLNKQGRCHLGVVLYDNLKSLVLAKHHILGNLVKKTVKKVVTSKIEFPNNCTMDLVFSQNLNKFKHMDVVVFNFLNGTYPRNRKASLATNPDQIFVFFSSEKPEPRAFTTPVDVMWTYHRSSEIWIPLGYLDKSRPLDNETKTPQQWVEGKSKLVLWIASNCQETTWPRLAFAQTLNKHVPVDIYGKCGQLQCTPFLAQKCTSDLIGRYKFYLALENGECGDYITEKVWEKPLMYGTVPIVYGPTRRDYEEILPRNSFIHLSDFKSMEELASYLKVLDSDPAKYAKYMEWRHQHGRILIGRQLFESFDNRLFEDLFIAASMKKKGQLKRRYLRDTVFAKSCRPRGRRNSSYGLSGWYPW